MHLQKGHREGLSDKGVLEETQMSNGNKPQNDQVNPEQAWCFEGMAGRPMIKGRVMGNQVRNIVRSLGLFK